jgi:formyltetrahydrofolate deformylase
VYTPQPLDASCCIRAQVLSRSFCERNAARTINIHHSFLPAFEGGRPYHRAHERGVKIIGATAHYATAELDAGPIIEQDVTRITHRDSVANMIRKGKDLERVVLARAVRAHLENRVIVHDNRTVVFEETN